ncbi:MAG: YggS family pyridoxal phosphate-dependent enzyme [Termitinemataceae bacterium]|nr:MAG: YggS family pyridoxal phosphate-dependent enzyme [Termitinemataceae bacterium]
MSGQIIAANIEKVLSEIDSCLVHCGRKHDDLRLMAVSKFNSIEKILEAAACGLNLFGESRVQEACEKFDSIRTTQNAAKYELHMIGSLQRNKVKSAVKIFDCVQSVDRNELIEELGKASLSEKKQISILLELNSGEESKSGYADCDALFYAAESALKHSYLKIAGLMTMAPNTENPKIISKAFSSVRSAQNKLQTMFPAADWSCLSMGMSGDFKIAIAEGSTLVRIGTAIFGDRTV